MPEITPSLWFDSEALDAAEFYVSLFPNSAVTKVTHYGGVIPDEAGPRKPGDVLTVDFVLDGHKFTAINGGPYFTFDEAISLLVACADQDEIDYFWEKLSDGGEEGQCGWLVDRYGLHWQVNPADLAELLDDSDRERSDRVMRAMLDMRKPDVAALRAAANPPNPRGRIQTPIP
ncbi:MAG: VOC family protein [Actinobacteria bacterium ATB1]|nr:VOC family protein [Actinobacteria bacterium ATB1]